jgi:hypothetical protein
VYNTPTLDAKYDESPGCAAVASAKTTNHKLQSVSDGCLSEEMPKTICRPLTPQTTASNWVKEVAWYVKHLPPVVVKATISKAWMIYPGNGLPSPLSLVRFLASTFIFCC